MPAVAILRLLTESPPRRIHVASAPCTEMRPRMARPQSRVSLAGPKMELPVTTSSCTFGRLCLRIARRYGQADYNCATFAVRVIPGNNFPLMSADYSVAYTQPQ